MTTSSISLFPPTWGFLHSSLHQWLLLDLYTKSEINYFCVWYYLGFESICFFLQVAHKELCVSLSSEDDGAVSVCLSLTLCRPHIAPTGPPGSEWPHTRGDGSAETVRTRERRTQNITNTATVNVFTLFLPSVPHLVMMYSEFIHF